MDDILRRICVEKGVFLRREAVELGYDQKVVTRLVRQGHWRRVRHGAYTLPDIWEPLSAEERHVITARAVLRTAEAPALLSHSSALLLHGAPLWDLPLAEVHTTRESGNAGRRQAGVRQHQGLLLPEDFAKVGDLPVTSPTRAALEVTTIADVEHSLVPVNALLHEGLTTLDALGQRNKAMNFWPDSLSTRLVLQLADPRMESVGETRTGYLLWAQGLPKPDPQFDIFDARGNLVARVDFAWPEHGVFLEFDGRIKYTRLLREDEDITDVVLREKKREELVCRITGWRCIRVTWAELENPQRLAAKIREALSGPPSYVA